MEDFVRYLFDVLDDCPAHFREGEKRRCGTRLGRPLVLRDDPAVPLVRLIPLVLRDDPVVLSVLRDNPVAPLVLRDNPVVPLILTVAPVLQERIFVGICVPPSTQCWTALSG